MRNNQADTNNHDHQPWPRFELAHFPQPMDDRANLALPLLKQGAPKDLFGRYRPLDELRLVDIPDYGQLVCFGISAGEHELFCLNPTTGAILDVFFNAPYGLPLFENMQFINILIVNASLAQFIASVQAIYEHFPFDEASKAHQDMSDAESDALFATTDCTASMFQSVLNSSDATAISKSNDQHYWDAFLSDLYIEGIEGFYEIIQTSELTN
jgi:hypothetical protein